MAVTHLEIHSQRPHEDGVAFGDTGPYERIDGTIHFAVDPGAPGNNQIIDLEKAERDAAGRVHFWADFCLLQPIQPGRANRRLLFEVLNRGRKLVPRHFNHAPAEPVASERIHPGDGFLMRHGWTMVWCGWQWDVVCSPALMGLEAPQALENGRPIQGQAACEFQPNEPIRAKLLANRVHQPYPTADVNDPEAILTVRAWPDAPRATIPRDRWRFAQDDNGQPIPANTHVWLEGGFEPGRVYEVIYRTSICPVVGAGLLAVRDTPAFLRHAGDSDGNPCAGRIDAVYGFGMSQSARFQRHFLHLGLNLDEAGRQVYDGLLVHVGGARRGQFNHRFAQPSDQSQVSFGHLPPFTDVDQADPVTGGTDGLLGRQQALGSVPRIFMTNTAAEYWRGDGSLAHSDLAGTADVEPGPDVRNYYFAGTQHGLGVVPFVDRDANEGSRGAHSFDVVDYAPLLRAALVNLDQWVSHGQEPPPSAFPRLVDGTAVPGPIALERVPAIPGATMPNPDRLPRMRRVELGPAAKNGILEHPVGRGDAYQTYVSAVDDDGNEVAGIRLPDLTVPLATFTGWNPRHPDTGGAGQIISMNGSTFPFPLTSKDRLRTGDFRPSIAERYRDRDDYLARVRQAAEQLVAQRYLMDEDVDLVLRLAGDRWDYLTSRKSP